MSDSEKVVLKSVEPQLVAASLGIIPNATEVEKIAPIIAKVFNIAYQHTQNNGLEKIGNLICIYHDIKLRDSDINLRDISIPIEGAVPIFETIPNSEQVWVYELPKVESMASIVHKGSLGTIQQSYDALFEWADRNNYQIMGSIREIYLEYDENRNPSATEVQFPVRKLKVQNFFSWFLSFFNNQD